MDSKKRKAKSKSKMKIPYRMVILNDKNLHTVRQMRFTIRSLVIYISLIIVLLITSIFSIVAFTRVRELIPGYPTMKMRQSLINNALRLDSVEHQLVVRDRYIRDFQMMLAGEDFVDNRIQADTVIRVEQVEFKSFNHDTIFQEKLAQEQFNLSLNSESKKSRDLSDLLFYAPMKGIITNSYNAQTGHFGIDIVNKLNSRVSAVLDGTVIFNGWTMQTGYVIHIQHNHGLITVYKHNSGLLKKAGDKVGGGEAIALMGNSGAETTGPHLHFEMWKDGNSLNPDDYICF
jgi:murein DD-endopeptidase MepM/ murein hydrolase activator NlpD